MPHDLPDEPKVPNPEILSWKDIVYPAIYILLLLVLAFLIWQLVSPFISVVVSVVLGYLLMLRKTISGKR